MLVRRIPDPVLAINHIPLDSTISRKEILKYKSLDTYMSNDLMGGNTWFLCISFTMKGANYNYTSALKKVTREEEFTREMLNAIKHAPIGTLIHLENIVVIGPDDMARTLHPWTGKLVQ